MFGCNARVDSYKVRKTAPAASSLPYGWGGTTLSAESQVQGERDGIARTTGADSPNAGDEPNPATQSIDVAEVARADVRPSGAAASKHPPQIPLAPMKRMQARFNPLADGLMYLVVFVGGFVGVGFRRATDLLLPSVNGSPFVVGTFVSNMLACFLFAMLTEYMATASWLRRRVRQVVSRGVGLGLLGGLSTMSGVMLEPWKACASSVSAARSAILREVSLAV